MSTRLQQEAALLVHATVGLATRTLERYGEGAELADAHGLCDAAFDLWTSITLPDKRINELGLVTVAP